MESIRKLVPALLCLFLPLAAPAEKSSSPFGVNVAVEESDGGPVIKLSFSVPAGHFLYADHLKVTAAGDMALNPVSVPAPSVIDDKFSGEKKKVYDRDFEMIYRPGDRFEELGLQVELQGCNDTVCFFPEKRVFGISRAPREGGGVEEPAAAPGAEASEDWRTWADKFAVAAQATGYLGKDEFLAFLSQSSAGPAGGHAESADLFQKYGVPAALLLILVGGILLNLTPCVLPLIPINLAIIGAGAKAGSRGRGFALGGAYGLGMALVYGLLGLVVVFTGSKFGTLNASPWFNAGIAVLFVVLGLAMFDLFLIDLSRFQSSVPGRAKKGSFLLALVMGAVAALLAGACVAPVVISVLLLAGSLYAKGVTLGLLLPFLLGLGMGLPWPFAGAGLSFLPKPGRWMTAVKYAFGVIILGFAAYYGWEAVRLFRSPGNTLATVLASELQTAHEQKRPVFIDFWATWCKNCHAMEATTFRDADVKKKLEGFRTVKYRAEKPNESPAREILDYYGVVGLPTYVVLIPK